MYIAIALSVCLLVHVCLVVCLVVAQTTRSEWFNVKHINDDLCMNAQLNKVSTVSFQF